MRRIALLVAALAGCVPTEPEITIRVQGTVTAAADGMPITGAKVEVWQGGFSSSLVDGAFSDTDGRYSLSFVKTGYCTEGCFASVSLIKATCGGFQTLGFSERDPDDTTYLRYTDEVQTIDFELDLAWKGASLVGVWGTSSSDVYAVGSDGAIGHYDGTNWSAMTNRTSDDRSIACGTSELLWAVWGTSSSDIYAVGDHGTILRYDGTGWGDMTSSRWDVSLRAVWGTSSSDVYAVGGSIILHYDGTEWSKMASNTASDLRAVWGTSSSDVYAVGNDWDGAIWKGTILHYDGTGWGDMTSSRWDVRLWVVWGTSSSDVFAVGGYGTILHLDGTEWSSMPSGTEVTLSAVWGTSSSDVYTVGDHGTILHYDGTGWSEMTSSEGDVRLYGVWGTSSSDVYAVGYDWDGAKWNGTILHYDGVAWSAVTS